MVVWIYATKTVGKDEVLKCSRSQQETFGNPEKIIYDRGTAFTSGDFKEYYDKEKISHLTITTVVPRGNGQVERINRIIISVPSKLSVDDPEKWFKHVSDVERTINSTNQRSVGSTPFKMFGIRTKTGKKFHIQKMIEEERLEEFTEERENFRTEAKINILKLQEENKRN